MGDLVPADHAAAKLPAAYEAARQALEACERIDECQDWADKHAALASYARQAKDETLERYCTRIKARAIRREGELLKRVPDASKRGFNQHSEAQEGDLPRLTRTNLAEAAGISEHQRKQALRVANVPGDEFECAIERERPATVSELAKLGTSPRARDRDSAAPAEHTQSRRMPDERKAGASISTPRTPASEASSETRIAQLLVQRLIDLYGAIDRGEIPRPKECRAQFTAAEIEKLRGAIFSIVPYLEQLRVAICPRCNHEGCAYCDPSMRRRP
jgi:hypothetical protein